MPKDLCRTGRPEFHGRDRRTTVTESPQAAPEAESSAAGARYTLLQLGPGGEILPIESSDDGDRLRLEALQLRSRHVHAWVRPRALAPERAPEPEPVPDREGMMPAALAAAAFLAVVCALAAFAVAR